MASFSFNSAEVAPTGNDFEPLPAGNYPAVALSSEMKTTKAGGEMLTYKLQVTEGQYAGRVLFARFNTVNASAKAQEIGLGQLSAFCRAAGVVEMTDTDDLLGRPVSVKVAVREAQNGYSAQNEVKGFASLTAAPSTPSYPAPPAAPSAARPGAAAKPWQKAA